MAYTNVYATVIQREGRTTVLGSSLIANYTYCRMFRMSLKVVKSTLDAGKAGHCPHIPSPLMYEWHGTQYLGAAHGLAGILTVLLQVEWVWLEGVWLHVWEGVWVWMWEWAVNACVPLSVGMFVVDVVEAHATTVH